MADTLEFGLQPTREHAGLYVDVPPAVWETAGTLGADKLLESVQKSKVITVEPQGGGTERVVIQSRLVGSRLRETTNRPLRDTVGYLSVVALAAASIGRQDPKLHVSFGEPNRPRSGYAMQLHFRWPQRNNDGLRLQATAAMKRMATDLRYAFNPATHRSPTASNYVDYVAEVVSAQVDRRTGVSLTVDAREGAKLATNRNAYQPQHPVAYLESYGLSSYKHQLVCLAGAVALATA